MSKLATRTGYLCLLTLALNWPQTANAQAAPTANFSTVASGFYHIDQQKHVVVVNQALPASTGTPQLAGLMLNEYYQFAQAPARLELGQAYAATCRGVAYTVYFTQLPVIHIDTRRTIADTPSVHASFRLSETSGATTTADLGIEVRGGYSQTYPKKSYELAFWADTLGKTSRELALLGMRTDDKWNLQALYNEPLRANNKVAHALWQELYQPYYKAKEPDAKSGIALEYAEVFVNNAYQGIYALTERVDRKQLKLKKYSAGIKGELYKGASWDAAVSFTDAPPFDNKNAYWSGFEYKYPDEKIDWTNLAAFIGFVKNSADADFKAQVQARLKLASAVDYYIFLNVTRAVDNTGKNLYIAKYTTGEPYFFVPWDLDGVFGTNWFGARDPVTTDLLTNNLFRRLNQDCSPTGFRPALAQRWRELRAGILTEEHILAKYQAAIGTLKRNGAYEREHLAWPSYTYSDDEQRYLATWLHERFAYLDGAFGQTCAGVLSAAGSQAATPAQLYPNPASGYVTITTELGAGRVSIRELSGRVVLEAALAGRSTQLPLAGLPKGLYLVSISTASGTSTQKLAVE